MSDVDEAVKLLRISPDLVFRFFAAFSRFEYALKRSGFIGTRPKIKIEECWEAFAKTKRVEKCFNEVCSQDTRTADALTFLTKKPPKQQCLGPHGLTFEDVKDGQKGLLQVTLWLRRIRNNLFHGGKYPMPLGPFDPVREEQLIESGLVLLEAFLKCDASLRHAFLERA